MDAFRKIQKSQCSDGSKKQQGKYGCSCCRWTGNTNLFKKVTRRLARRRLARLPMD